MKPAKYWIVVASEDHVRRGVRENIIQACHGKATPLQRMRPGDWVVMYSPKNRFGGTQKCQKFTAIGQVADAPVYKQALTADFEPYRRKVNYHPCREVPIQPLVPQLSFILNKQRWGYLFRTGFFEIFAPDFNLLAALLLATNHD
jgi:predicted RNA-binding protein